MIYGKNLTAIIADEDVDNTSNIEVINLIGLSLKVEESLKWFRLYTERLTNLIKPVTSYAEVNDPWRSRFDLPD